MSPTIAMPEVPVLGLPEGEKDAGQRVDFKPTKFDLLIENKGYLLAWTRASQCPCTPVDSKTTQPDPNCPLCNGEGWFYFGGNQSQDLSAYNFDDIQRKIVEDSGAMLIRGSLTDVMHEYNTLDRLTHWEAGTMNVTVRHQNKLGLYDKLVVMWPEIVFSEVVVADGTDILRTRYLATGINQARGAASGAVTGTEPIQYLQGTDYELDSEGHLVWYPGSEPASGTRVALHYTCHPTFLVTEHPHVVRSTLKKFKKDPTTLDTPLGDANPLPIQARVKYDFLP